jgi:hypothetical protein
MGEWRYSSTILNLGTRWNFTPLPLYSRENSPRYPLYRRWVGPRAGLDVMEKREIYFPCRELNSIVT